jgi:hypothetical protein
MRSGARWIATKFVQPVEELDLRFWRPVKWAGVQRAGSAPVSSLAARKQRNYRKRRSCGVAVLRIELPLYPLTSALLTAGRLTPEQALNRGEIERQAGMILEEWRKQWEGLC